MLYTKPFFLGGGVGVEVFPGIAATQVQIF